VSIPRVRFAFCAKPEKGGWLVATGAACEGMGPLICLYPLRDGADIYAVLKIAVSLRGWSRTSGILGKPDFSLLG
jgi:hypothetical protein